VLINITQREAVLTECQQIQRTVQRKSATPLHKSAQRIWHHTLNRKN